MQAVRDAGLDDVLGGDEALTVFAPNSVALSSAGSSLSLTSLAGTPIKFYKLSGSLRLAGEGGVLASFVGEPLSAKNGELYIINSVIAK